MIGLGLSITQLAVRQMLGGSFNPLDLFANGEPGAWYDPSDMSTLYQDAAGTTPVTAVEQPVGLMLDKSKGLVLGGELVVNGGFDSDVSGWTAFGSGGSSAWSSGALRLTVTAGGSGTFGRYQDISVTAGRAQRITISARRISGNATCRINTYEGGGFTGAMYGSTIASTDYAELSFVVAPMTSSLRVYFNAVSGASITETLYDIDNISVRELPGNHAFQTTATSRPVLSARVNLLTKTEQFDDAAWAKQNATITANTVVAPDGTLTGDKVVATTATGAHYVNTATITTSGTTTLSVYAKAGEYGWLFVQLSGAGSNAFFNLNEGTVGTVNGSTATITAVGNGWYRCTITDTTVTNPVVVIWPTTGNNVVSYTGDGTSGIYIWGASLVPANQADLPYQRVNTATDYDSDPAKFPRYLRCDGIDDWMVTGTITPGTDKVQVITGVRKLSDAAQGAIAEFGANTTVSGYMAMWTGTPTVANGSYHYNSKGTANTSAISAAVYASPITNVLTGLGDISGDQAILRIDGTQAAQSTADQGTGNFGNHPLYLFRRGGTSLPFNGHFYGAVIRFGDNLPIETIQQTEAYMNSKTQAIDWRDITDSSSFRWNSATASPDAE